MAKPGVLLYFDIIPCLEQLSNEQKGILFSAIVCYAAEGVLPELEDPMLGLAWSLIRPRIDRDNERYEKVAESRKNAAARRWGQIA